MPARVLASIKKAASVLGQHAAKTQSAAKRRASRENGKKGGRPKNKK